MAVVAGPTLSAHISFTYQLISVHALSDNKTDTKGGQMGKDESTNGFRHLGGIIAAAKVDNLATEGMQTV